MKRTFKCTGPNCDHTQFTYVTGNVTFTHTHHPSKKQYQMKEQK